MNGKILWTDTVYDESGTHYVVCKNTKYGTFIGRTTLAPADEDIENTFDGFRFAELRCDIQAYHRRALNFYERYRGMLHALNVLTSSWEDNDFDEDPMIEALQRQVEVAYKNYLEAFDLYKRLRDSYKGYTEVVLEQRRTMHMRIAELRNRHK